MPDDPAPISLAERLKALESRLEPEDVSDVEKTPAPASATKPSTRRSAAKKAAAEPAPVSAEPASAAAAATAPRTTAKAATRKAAEKKAPATQAAPAKEPAASAAARAKKAPATRAPATKPPATKAPAKKAPTKKATTTKAPAATLAPAAAATTPPSAPATKAVGAAVRPESQAASEVRLFDSIAAAEPETPPPPPPTVPRSRTPLVYRVLMVASVFLFAAALGLFAAAVVESGPERWSSTSTVQLVPGPAPSTVGTDAVAAGQHQYAGQLGRLTSRAAAAGGVPDSAVRDLSAKPGGNGELVITAEAAHAGQAERLAGAAAETLVAVVPADQARTVATPGDRLTAVVASSVTPAEQIRPSDTLAAVAGALVAAGVLLFALCLVLIRTAAKD